MPGKLFINYRRDDTRADARSIRDRLAKVFGNASVFMDVDNLQPGQRFDQELGKALEQCDVFLALIGERWMDILRERTKSGERDFVCEEIAEALSKGVTVIPVLIEGARLPRPDLLPTDIAPMVLHQTSTVSHTTFGRDMDGLVAAIKSARKGYKTAPGAGAMAIAGSAARKTGKWLAYAAATGIGLFVLATLGAAGMKEWRRYEQRAAAQQTEARSKAAEFLMQRNAENERARAVERNQFSLQGCTASSGVPPGAVIQVPSVVCRFTLVPTSLAGR